METNVKMQQLQLRYNNAVYRRSRSLLPILRWMDYRCALCVCPWVWTTHFITNASLKSVVLLNGVLRACQLSLYPQWSLMTAWGMKQWFSRAVTPSSACGQMGPSLPKEREPAWMSRSSLNSQQMVHTHKCGRPWSNWRSLTHLHFNKMKMRWVTHSAAQSNITR